MVALAVCGKKEAVNPCCVLGLRADGIKGVSQTERRPYNNKRTKRPTKTQSGNEGFLVRATSPARLSRPSQTHTCRVSTHAAGHRAAVKNHVTAVKGLLSKGSSLFLLTYQCIALWPPPTGTPTSNGRQRTRHRYQLLKCCRPRGFPVSMAAEGDDAVLQPLAASPAEMKEADDAAVGAYVHGSVPPRHAVHRQERSFQLHRERANPIEGAVHASSQSIHSVGT